MIMNYFQKKKKKKEIRKKRTNLTALLAAQLQLATNKGGAESPLLFSKVMETLEEKH